MTIDIIDNTQNNTLPNFAACPMVTQIYKTWSEIWVPRNLAAKKKNKFRRDFAQNCDLIMNISKT